MPRRVDGGPDRRDVIDDTRGGVDLDDEDRLDVPSRVGAQARLERRGIDGAAPVARQGLDREPEHVALLTPAAREAPALQHQHPVAPRQGVRQRRLPAPVSVGDVDVGRPRRPEDGLEVLEARLGRPQQVLRIDVDGGPVHRLEDDLGHVRGAGDRQELAAAREGDRADAERRCAGRLGGGVVEHRQTDPAEGTVGRVALVHLCRQAMGATRSAPPARHPGAAARRLRSVRTCRVPLCRRLKCCLTDSILPAVLSGLRCGPTRRRRVAHLPFWPRPPFRSGVAAGRAFPSLLPRPHRWDRHRHRTRPTPKPRPSETRRWRRRWSSCSSPSARSA